MAVNREFIVNLKGREYATWPGVLDEATRLGLKTLETELVQIPSEENGWTAIVQATAAFEDGRLFTDYGDASPKNCSPQIATAAIRMASTRAKGRCLRDAINCGQTLLEELPDDEREERAPRAAESRRPAASPAARPVHANPGAAAGVVADASTGPLCSVEGCGSLLTERELSGCLQAGWPRLCTDHAREYKAGLALKQAAEAT